MTTSTDYLQAHLSIRDFESRLASVFWGEVIPFTLLPPNFFVIIKVKVRNQFSLVVRPRFNFLLLAILLFLAAWPISSLTFAAWAFQQQSDSDAGEGKLAEIILSTQLVSQFLVALVLVGLCLPGQLRKNIA